MEKTLILTGAGFAHSWGGPLTSNVTEALISKNEILRVLFMYYEAKGYKLNFEELLNIIELLFQNCYGKTFGKKNLVFVPIANVFDVQKDISRFRELDLELNEENKTLAIRNRYFDVIVNVVEIIRKYATAVKNRKYEELNSNLNRFVSDVKGDNPLRYYTTNYDRLFIEVCPETQFFDGFSDKNIIEQNEESFRTPDSKKILLDRLTDCHYNLHGSIYWDIQRGNTNIVCSQNSVICDSANYINYNKLADSNPKEFQIVSPIITGLQKTQRTNIAPFNAMSSSFLTDCFECDVWYILGYSFSDPHINNMLRTALADKNAKSKKIVWVSSETNHINNMENSFTNLPFRELFVQQINLESKDFVRKQDYSFYSKEHDLGLYFGGFSAFLEKEIWKQFK